MGTTCGQLRSAELNCEWMELLLHCYLPQLSNNTNIQFHNLATNNFGKTLATNIAIGRNVVSKVTRGPTHSTINFNE